MTVDELKQICKTASPAPWTSQPTEDDYAIVDAHGTLIVGAGWVDGPRLILREKDEHLILTTRNELPKLLERLENLEGENQRLREALKECSDDLETYVEQEHPQDMREHPVVERRYQRDVAPVVHARRLLSDNPVEES